MCPIISGCQKKPVISQVEELHCSMAVIMCPYANRQILKVLRKLQKPFHPFAYETIRCCRGHANELRVWRTFSVLLHITANSHVYLILLINNAGHDLEIGEHNGS